MSDSELSSAISAWELTAKVGYLLVIVGVALEGAEYFVKWGRKRKLRIWIGARFEKDRRRTVVKLVKWLKPQLLPVESVGFGLLIVGLGLELWAGSMAGSLKGEENARLKAQAGEAIKQAEVIRRDNLVLEARLQPRRITDKQKARFIEILKPASKCEMKVIVSSHALPRTRLFATHFREMLTEAGFGTNNEVIVVEGLMSLMTEVHYTKPEDWVLAMYHGQVDQPIPHPYGHPPSVLVFTNTGPNDFTFGNWRFRNFTMEPLTNTTHTYFKTEDPHLILCGTRDVLNEVGIRTGFMPAPIAMKPGQVAFFIQEQAW